MKCSPSAVNIILLKGHTIPYLVRHGCYLVGNMWLPSRCTSHRSSAPYMILGKYWANNIERITQITYHMQVYTDYMTDFVPLISMAVFIDPQIRVAKSGFYGFCKTQFFQTFCQICPVFCQIFIFERSNLK